MFSLSIFLTCVTSTCDKGSETAEYPIVKAWSAQANWIGFRCTGRIANLLRKILNVQVETEMFSA